MSLKKPVAGAILQRDRKTYAIVPRIPAGLIMRADLKAISKVVEKYDIPMIKVTSGQRIALVGMSEEQILPIYNDLGMEPGEALEPCFHYVQACPGTDICKFGIQDSLGFGKKLEQLFFNKEFPAKFKIGVSGCPFCCAENYVRDIGLMGKKKGWTLSFGGSSGRQVRKGDILAADLSDDDTVELIEKCLKYYIKNAKKRERTSSFMKRVGVDELKKELL